MMRSMIEVIVLKYITTDDGVELVLYVAIYTSLRKKNLVTLFFIFVDNNRYVCDVMTIRMTYDGVEVEESRKMTNLHYYIS